MTSQKTYSAKLSEISHKWWIIDATDIVLGRLASQVANIIIGKHKPTYTTHMDCGDHVIIINADKIALTGKKREDKVYYRHTGHPGGIKETTPRKILESKYPERVVQLAVKRMLNRARHKLGADQFRKLHVYAGAEHPHQAQQPVVIDFAARNKKNKRVAQ